MVINSIKGAGLEILKRQSDKRLVILDLVLVVIVISFYIINVLKNDPSKLVENLSIICQFMLVATLAFSLSYIDADKKDKQLKDYYPFLVFLSVFIITFLPRTPLFDKGSLTSDSIFFIIYTVVTITLSLGASIRLVSIGKMKSAITKLVLFIIIHLIMFSLVYAKYGIADSTGEITHDYIDALYFSIVTWTTLGYGDFHPEASIRLYASFEAIIGYVFLGMLLYLMTKKSTTGSQNVTSYKHFKMLQLSDEIFQLYSIEEDEVLRKSIKSLKNQFKHSYFLGDNLSDEINLILEEILLALEKCDLNKVSVLTLEEELNCFRLGFLVSKMHAELQYDD